jgi:hypothetical protein
VHSVNLTGIKNVMSELGGGGEVMFILLLNVNSHL